eukprot:TRINITY_DN9192_c0_g1_i1.p2 TRINITY_DN9192_c0_g1~~TRINITY_DN9192_c0_g1_i1.p2  ORF type:complete len:249 (-),score=61.70 TRINITY_DN9192_c0_g1_i1:56-802(-)
MKPGRIVGIFFMVVAAAFLLTAIIWPVVISKRTKFTAPKWNKDGVEIPTLANLESKDFTFALNKLQWTTYRYDVPQGTPSSALLMNFDVLVGETFYYNSGWTSDTQINNFTRTLTYPYGRNVTWTVCEGSNYFNLFWNQTTVSTQRNLQGHLKSDKSKVSIDFCKWAEEVEDFFTKVGAVFVGIMIGVPGICCLVGGLCCFSCAGGDSHHHYHAVQSTDNNHYQTSYPPQPAYGQPGYGTVQNPPKYV